MPHDVIFDVIKSINTGKIACPLTIDQHIFIGSLSVSMLEWKYTSIFFLHCCRMIHGQSFKFYVINHSGPIGLLDHITMHSNLNCALFYNKSTQN